MGCAAFPGPLAPVLRCAVLAGLGPDPVPDPTPVPDPVPDPVPEPVP